MFKLALANASRHVLLRSKVLEVVCFYNVMLRMSIIVFCTSCQWIMLWVNYKAEASSVNSIMPEKRVLYVYVVTGVELLVVSIGLPGLPDHADLTKSRNWIFTHVGLSAHAHNNYCARGWSSRMAFFLFLRVRNSKNQCQLIQVFSGTIDRPKW